MAIRQLRDSPHVDSDAEYTIKQKEVALDKELLQLVQGACKADNLQRALDLTRLMHNPASVEAATKIAGFYHLPGLQERMAGVKGVVDRKRRRVQEAPRRIEYISNGQGQGNGTGEKKGFTDFAPRNNRRSFGGKVRIDRDSTPAQPTATGNGTYIPETPRTEIESTPAFEEPDSYPSPDVKRKREETESVVGDEENFAPVTKKVDASFKGMYHLSLAETEGML
jgi:chromosome transmission fidelity protein 4